MALYRTREGYLTDWPGTAEQAARHGWVPEGEDGPAYDRLLKNDLVGLAAARGVDSDGTKAELVERLTAADTGDSEG